MHGNKSSVICRYAKVENTSRYITALPIGEALVQAYWNAGLAAVWQPAIRAWFESCLGDVASGKLEKSEVGWKGTSLGA